MQSYFASRQSILTRIAFIRHIEMKMWHIVPIHRDHIEWSATSGSWIQAEVHFVFAATHRFLCTKGTPAVTRRPRTLALRACQRRSRQYAPRYHQWRERMKILSVCSLQFTIQWTQACKYAALWYAHSLAGSYSVGAQNAHIREQDRTTPLCLHCKPSVERTFGPSV